MRFVVGVMGPAKASKRTSTMRGSLENSLHDAVGSY